MDISKTSYLVIYWAQIKHFRLNLACLTVEYVNTIDVVPYDFSFSVIIDTTKHFVMDL